MTDEEKEHLFELLGIIGERLGDIAVTLEEMNQKMDVDHGK